MGSKPPLEVGAETMGLAHEPRSKAQQNPQFIQEPPELLQACQAALAFLKGDANYSRIRTMQILEAAIAAQKESE